jgi:CheY-like chemotaxis protein
MTTDGMILLVEDNEDDVFLMKRALKLAGVANPMVVVTDGEQAIDYLAGEGKYTDRQTFPMPAVVFLDLKLPLRSGHEVLAWIRGQKSLESLVVVVLTSSDEPSDLRRAYSLGANSYLVKPLTPKQLSNLADAFNWSWLKFNTPQPGPAPSGSSS